MAFTATKAWIAAIGVTTLLAFSVSCVLIGYRWVDKQTEAISNQAAELTQSKINEAAERINAETAKKAEEDLKRQLVDSKNRTTQLELDYATARKQRDALAKQLDLAKIKEQALSQPTELGSELTENTMVLFSKFGKLETANKTPADGGGK